MGIRVIAVDDEKIGLEALVHSIEKAEPTAEIQSFRKPEEALAFARENRVDVAFLDIQMRGMDGITLGKAIKIANPKVNIVFVTGYSEYKGEAFDMRASGYIAKPVTKDEVLSELQNLRNPIPNEEVIDMNAKVVARTFGTFEIFVDNQPIRFKYEKTKELMAYLIDRNGAFCSMGDIAINLWEDDENHSSYLRGLKKDLVDSFEQRGITNIIYQKRGSLAVNTEMLVCDYYEFLSGNVTALNAYHGEYMAQYSWSEITNASLEMGRK